LYRAVSGLFSVVQDRPRVRTTIQAAAMTVQTDHRIVHSMMNTTIDRLAIDRDADLVEALRGRHASAAEQLVARYGDRAYRLALRIAGNRQDAEEALQDAFWNVIRRIDTFRGESSLGSWIYRITANAAYQKRRRDAHRRDSISLDEVLPRLDEHGRYTDPIVDWSTELADPAVQTELRSVLTSALEELPDHYRAVTILHDVEGLSMAEVAACLDITVPTAKARAHRARLLLRQRLGEFMSGEPSRVEMAS
jgi:RNA polymerase sigma-70 factor, ECF subfamily